MKDRNECIFCRIADGNMKANILYQDDEIVAFPDINPVAPVHILIISRKHISTLAEMSEEDTYLIGAMAKVANRLARDKGIAEKGYRLVINSGTEGGQVIDHLHLHLIGGRLLGSKLS
jgi:histidine triad (HIT) family protein